MQRTIMITYWKGAGVPHLPLIHPKTGMSEALRQYFGVEGLAKTPENMTKRQAALQTIYNVIQAMSNMYSVSAHPKLNAVLKKMKAGVIAEVADYNAFFTQFENWVVVKNHPEGSGLFRAHCVKEYSPENFDFLTAIDEKNHPNIIYATFVDPSCSQLVNLPDAVSKPLIANHATLASFKPAYNLVRTVLIDQGTLKRFVAENLLNIKTS